MATADMASILSKVDAYMNSSAGKDKISKAIDNKVLSKSDGSAHTPQEAANKFIEILQKSIAGSGLSANVVSAISGITASAPHKISDGMYLVVVSFSGDTSRPSLAPSEYGGIAHLEELFDHGVGHQMNPVYGVWIGHGSSKIVSKTVIPGTHFIDAAVNEFKSSYGEEYNLIDIDVIRAYEGSLGYIS